MFRFLAAPMLAAGLLLSSLQPAAAAGRSWHGEVSHVSDGDTLWVRPASGPPRKIRLYGIDAPERCQDGGGAAAAALARRALGQPVRVQALRRDDYGRLLARVWLHGEDVGAQLVREGQAWSYRYRRNPGPYLREEQGARAAGRGLFARPDALRPYEFRRRHGPCGR